MFQRSAPVDTYCPPKFSPLPITYDAPRSRTPTHRDTLFLMPRELSIPSPKTRCGFVLQKNKKIAACAQKTP
jgi:hypothetical protein